MDGKTMLIGVLAIAVAVLGYLYYGRSAGEGENRPSGCED